MKRLFLVTTLISIISCRKENNSIQKYNPPPAVVKIETSSESINGIAHPKFSITFNIPDTAAVSDFIISKNNSSIPCALIKPHGDTTYTITDIFTNYPLPAGDKTYRSFFVMADNSIIESVNVDVN